MMPESISRARFQIVEGPDAILALLPELVPWAERWGQAAEAAELPHHTTLRLLGGRRPLLVLVKDPEQANEAALLGAVLVFAYGARVFGNRLISNGDRLGRIGVFGRSEDRVEIAGVAVRALLQQGAKLIRLSFAVAGSGEGNSEVSPLAAARMQMGMHLLQAGDGLAWELRLQWRPSFYALPADPDKAVAGLGWSSRKSLRAARNGSVRDHGASFVANPMLSLAEFMQLNRVSKYPVSSRIARRRFLVAQSEGGFLAGIRAANGDWMAVAGGRRSSDTAIIDWQMNGVVYARYSVSLLMRGYLMRHFSQEGKRRLILEGGTSHRMAKSFVKLPVYALSVRRPELWLRLLEWVMLTWVPLRGMTLNLFDAPRLHPPVMSPERLPPEGC